MCVYNIVNKLLALFARARNLSQHQSTSCVCVGIFFFVVAFLLYYSWTSA